jgi:hypothetical protein
LIFLFDLPLWNALIQKHQIRDAENGSTVTKVF